MSEIKGMPIDEKEKAGATIIETTTLTVACDPHGMSSGKPSLCFRFDLTDGNIVMCYSSVSALQMLTSAIRGRLAFLGLDEEGRPLSAPDRSAN